VGERPPKGLWERALWFADRTPESRNRYVDFLRALSILAVVLGHWLISAPHFADGRPAYSQLLEVAPWSRWLTWLFQVMPLFFFVGGFSNGVSWESARRKQIPFGQWLDARSRRLLGPVLPLIVMWGLTTAVAHVNGVEAGMIQVGSQTALIPIWFLAVYILVVALVPWTFAAWRRWHLMSVLVPVAAAAVVDVAFFAAGLRAFGWLNYPFVWLAVHQLGYAWREGRLPAPPACLALLFGGLLALVLLTHVGPYPLSLVGVPGAGVSNTLPPKLPLLALAAAQVGLLLALEQRMRRWLRGRVVWAVTILVNGIIMTIYLWHSTVMILLVGLAFWKLPAVLMQVPDSTAWWSARPLWLLACAVCSLPFLLAFARFERAGAAQGVAPVWRQILGAIVTCAGLAALALGGTAGDGWLGLRWLPLLLPVAGTALAGFGPLAILTRSGRPAAT